MNAAATSHTCTHELSERASFKIFLSFSSLCGAPKKRGGEIVYSSVKEVSADLRKEVFSSLAR